MPFKARGDIDAIAHQVAVALLDHIAEMDADAELDATLGRKTSVALDHAVLHLDGAAHGIHDASELYEDSVTRPLHYATVMQRRWSGSIRSLRSARSRASVRSSSEPASLLYPTTSAARIAASFRVSAMAVPSPHARLARLLVGLDRLFRLADHCSPAANQDAIMDIGGWLRSLGLEQYEATFRENEINEKVLPNLTARGPEGYWRRHCWASQKLLDAIALLRADGSAKAPPSEAPSTTLKPAQDTAERRQVTVLFSDLVGSTALSARMDPEDLREVISAYQKCVAETVQRFGGFVAKYMGDGVLVYFGYPQAHEDDPERAVRAGLELIQAVNALKSSAPLQTRVGIATGLVVVGDLIGSGAAQEQTVVGETPNLAARLQGACRAEHGRHRREHAKAARQPVRAGGPWGQGPQGHLRAGTSLGGAAAELRWKAASRRCTRPD